MCVLPLRRTAYTDLAVSVRLTDLLALGKPTVASASLAAEAFVGPSAAVAFVSDAPGDLAAAIIRLLDDPAAADELGRRARAFAERDDVTWGRRADQVMEALLGVLPGEVERRDQR